MSTKATKRVKSPASRATRLSGAELRSVNFVDALRGFADITGIEVTEEGGDESILARFFPSAVVRTKLLLALKLLTTVFPFPRLGLSLSLALPSRGAMMSLEEIGEVLRGAAAAVPLDAQGLTDENTSLDDPSSFDALESLAVAMELKSMLLRLAAEVQVLELKVRAGERDALLKALPANDEHPPPAADLEQNLQRVFEESFRLD